MTTHGTSGYPTACACSNVLCLQYGCMMHAKVHEYTPPPRGCICPPGANKECENQFCPRKPHRISAHIEIKNESR